MKSNDRGYDKPNKFGGSAFAPLLAFVLAVNDCLPRTEVDLNTYDGSRSAAKHLPCVCVCLTSNFNSEICPALQESWYIYTQPAQGLRRHPPLSSCGLGRLSSSPLPLYIFMDSRGSSSSGPGREDRPTLPPFQDLFGCGWHEIVRTLTAERNRLQHTYPSILDHRIPTLTPHGERHTPLLRTSASSMWLTAARRMGVILRRRVTHRAARILRAVCKAHLPPHTPFRCRNTRQDRHIPLGCHLHGHIRRRARSMPGMVSRRRRRRDHQPWNARDLIPTRTQTMSNRTALIPAAVDTRRKWHRLPIRRGTGTHAASHCTIPTCRPEWFRRHHYPHPILAGFPRTRGVQKLRSQPHRTHTMGRPRRRDTSASTAARASRGRAASRCVARGAVPWVSS
jgi:hypothetical protein